MKLVIATMGTSILRNEISQKEKAILNITSNKKEENLSNEEKKIIDDIAERKKAILLNSSLLEVRKLSAELNGLIGFYEMDLSKGAKNLHFLLKSDTYQGRKSAEIISEWMREKGLHVESVGFPGLNTSNITDFTSAMSDVIKWCDSVLPGYRNQGYSVIFSLVGGFKSFQGFMQALGMFYADESIYIYENANEILRLPQIPIDLDSSFASIIKKNHSIIRRMLYKEIPEHECESLPDILLYKMDGLCALSPWGELAFNKFKEKYYSSEVLLPPPSQRIKISDKTIESIINDKSRIRDFNERMDDLSRFLETNQNIKRLDFKKLAGNPFPPCTHEIDLSADKGAWRIFGYFKGNNFVIHHIGESPLH